MGIIRQPKKRRKVIGVDIFTDERTEIMCVTTAEKSLKIKHYDMLSSLHSDYYPAKKRKWFYEDKFYEALEDGTLDKIIAKTRDYYNRINYKKQIVCIDAHGCKFEYPSISAASDDTLVSYSDIYNECQREKKKGIYGYKFYYKHVYENAAERMQEAKQAYLELM